MIKKSKLLGFTLIELLVVISIIGILIALSGFGLQGARSAARDSRRKADIEQIRSALELYKADCGDYPTSAVFPVVAGTLVGDGSPASCAASNSYIVNRPGDPLPGRTYRYVQMSATTYEICVAMENGGGSVSCGGSNLCGSGVTCNYRVTNP